VQTNLNAPRLVLADKLSEAELTQLLRRRFMPEAGEQEHAVDAVAAGIAMQTTDCNQNCNQGRACDCVADVHDEGADALERQLDAVNAGVWRWSLVGCALIGLLWVAFK
jgi:hypothetical protein